MAIITVLLALAVGWWGYNWFQNQNSGLNNTETEAPSNDLFDDGVGQDAPPAPGVPTVADPAPNENNDDFDLSQDILADTILLLEQRLFNLNFLSDGTYVDGDYDAASLGAMMEFAETIANADLRDEILAAGLSPQIDQLEQWIILLEQLLS